MILSTIALAIIPNIDAFCLGITYHLTRTKITRSAYFIIFFISLFLTTTAMYLSFILKENVNAILMHYLGAIFLMLLGLYLISNALRKSKKSHSPQKIVTSKQAFYLGIALSMDSIGFVFGFMITGICNVFYPLLLSIFQFLLIKTGLFIGNRVINFFRLPLNFWLILSGSLIFIFGLLELCM